jgi:hypothetical protein
MDECWEMVYLRLSEENEMQDKPDKQRRQKDLMPPIWGNSRLMERGRAWGVDGDGGCKPEGGRGGGELWVDKRPQLVACDSSFVASALPTLLQHDAHPPITDGP